MDEFPGGEPTNRETTISAIESATKSILESSQYEIEGDIREYPVADLIGRCFLRVCFWADLLEAWTRRERPIQVRASEEHAAADQLLEDK